MLNAESFAAKRIREYTKLKVAQSESTGSDLLAFPLFSGAFWFSLLGFPLFKANRPMFFVAPKANRAFGFWGPLWAEDLYGAVKRAQARHLFD